MAPIKRHEALVSFSRDHHNGLLLVWKIRQGLKKDIEPARIGNYVTYSFQTDLESHFLDEEKWLFPELPVGAPGRVRAESDHRELRNTAMAIKSNANEELLNSFADSLEQHIRFEERELFNEIQLLPDEKLVPIAERFKGHVCANDDEWSDKFWL